MSLSQFDVVLAAGCPSALLHGKNVNCDPALVAINPEHGVHLPVHVNEISSALRLPAIRGFCSFSR